VEKRGIFGEVFEKFKKRRRGVSIKAIER